MTRPGRAATRHLASLLLGGAMIATLPARAQVADRVPVEKPADPAPVTDPLLAGFQSPPAVAKPRTWWHWMNGNVTQAGIVADLEWMHRVGIGGVHYFDAGGALANYSFITPRLVVGDANWRAAVNLAARTTDRLGMELTTAASPGWSETGGPWVTPAQAEKKYVWSETLVEGGQRFAGTLAPPPRRTGGFQNAGRTGGFAPVDPNEVNPEFYADAMVVAYRLPTADLAAAPTRITSSGGVLDASRLADGDVAATQSVTAEAGASAVWIQADYAQVVTVRGLVLGVTGSGASEGPDKPRIEVSDDGHSWRAGTTLTGPADAVVKTYGFAPLTARHFRLVLPPEPAKPPLAGMPSPPPRSGPVTIPVSEFVLRTSGTVDRFVEKAGFSEPIDYAAAPTAPVDRAAVIARRDVIDLTGRMMPDGTLDWTPPKGRWRVIRLGYSLTGTRNSPAPVEATGLEVDKFSPRHIRAYLDEYLGRFSAATGPDLIGRRGLQNLLSDSWEAGVQNWTDDMRGEFKRRRGYDLAPWLPVLTGHVVDSADASDRFLWDYRRTLQDLLARHYAVLHDELGKRGMGFYAEAQGDTWRAIGDGMEMKSRSDIPMAEYWYRSFAAGPGQPTLKTDMKESASVAHLYGKPLVANESLTVFSAMTPWSYSPAMLKPVVDEIFAYGINRFVLHTSVHQPLMDKKPGLALGPFGQYISRNETWAELAKPFFSYIARSSYMLQQGRFVADIAYFYGEDRPLVSVFGGAYDEATDRYRIEVPQGYGYDFINAETLKTATGVTDGQLTTSGGMRYRILYLRPDVTAMTLATLERIEALVKGGVVLVGERPRHALGLAASDAQVTAVADRIWGIVAPDSGVRALGKGRVYAGRSLAEVLAVETISPDVAFSNGAIDANILQLHRRTDDGSDIYYLTNRRGRPERITASFRTAGRAPELWHADSGRAAATGFHRDGNRTIVPLALGANEAVFVVFRKPTTETARSIPAPEVRTLATLATGWTLDFPAGSGAPAHIAMPTLTSWSDDPRDDVRFFSGTATYTNSITVPSAWPASGRRILLDLGTVHELAEVLVNGRSMGIAWKAPYSIDVTDALHAGANSVAIRVTNLWPNRLIGDARQGTTAPHTWTAAAIPGPTGPFSRMGWSATSPLLPAGLLGPVTLTAVQHAIAR